MEMLLFNDFFGYRLVIRDNKRQVILVWEVVSNLHKIPSKKYIDKLLDDNHNSNLSYISDERLKLVGTICWKRGI